MPVRVPQLRDVGRNTAGLTVNQQLLDAAVQNAVVIEQFKLAEVKRLGKFVNERLVPDLERQFADLGGRNTPTTRRLSAALVQANEVLRRAGARLERDTVEGAGRIAATVARLERHTLQTLTPVGLDHSFALPSIGQLKTAATAGPVHGRKVSKWFRDLERDTMTRLDQSMRIGLAQGESVPQLVRRIRGAGDAPGVIDTTRRQAETIVRTTANHASNVARDDVYKANADVIKEIRIVAALDARTSRICVSLDGRTFPVDSGMRPPFHPNCRTTTVPVLKDWSEFGVDAAELPEAVRASMDGNVPASTTYGEWLRRQPAGVQDRVLGQRGGELFRAGDLNVRQFVTKNLQPLDVRALNRRAATNRARQERKRRELAEAPDWLEPQGQAEQQRFEAAARAAEDASDDYWGGDEQSYWRPGPNPTVDAVVTRDGPDGPEVLLIQRGPGTTEGGKWALPGGFHDTHAGKGQFWTPGRETSRQAAIREVAEETGLNASKFTNRLQHVGTFKRHGRDPRDNMEAWSVSSAYKVHIPRNVTAQAVRGLDDASNAQWVPVRNLGKGKFRRMAFDHDRILQQAAVIPREVESRFELTRNPLSLVTRIRRGVTTARRGLEAVGRQVKAFFNDPIGVTKSGIRAAWKGAVKQYRGMRGEFLQAGLSSREASVAAGVIAASLASPVGVGTVLSPLAVGIPVVGVPLAVAMNSPVMGIAQQFGLKELVKVAGRTRSALSRFLARFTRPDLRAAGQHSHNVVGLLSGRISFQSLTASQQIARFQRMGFAESEAREMAATVLSYTFQGDRAVRGHYLGTAASRKAVEKGLVRHRAMLRRFGVSTPPITAASVAEDVERYIDRFIRKQGNFDPEAKLYRGVSGFLREQALNMRVGDRVTFNGPASTSTSRGVAEAFGRSQGDKVPIVFEVSGGVRRSVTLRPFSQFRGEAEVLLGNGVSLVVEGVEVTPKRVIIKVREDR